MKDNKLKKISLLLSGGGSRGAYHLGIIKALEELNFEICAISGASIGSIVGASYLSGKKPEEILEFFKKNSFKKAIKFNIFGGSLFRIDHDSAVFDELIDEKYKNIEDLPKPLYMSVTNIEKGFAEYKNSGNIKELACASSALYPVFAPVIHNDEKLIDGGFVDNFPISPLLELKYPIFGVNLHPNFYNKKQFMLKRTIFLAWYMSGLHEKIKKCEYYLSSEKLTEHFILKTKGIENLFHLGYQNTLDLFDKNG